MNFWGAEESRCQSCDRNQGGIYFDMKLPDEFGGRQRMSFCDAICMIAWARKSGMELALTAGERMLAFQNEAVR